MYDFQSSGNLMQQLQLINARCEKETQIKWLFDKTKLKSNHYDNIILTHC